IFSSDRDDEFFTPNKSNVLTESNQKFNKSTISFVNESNLFVDASNDHRGIDKENISQYHAVCNQLNECRLEVDSLKRCIENRDNQVQKLSEKNSELIKDSNRLRDENYSLMQYLKTIPSNSYLKSLEDSIVSKNKEIEDLSKKEEWWKNQHAGKLKIITQLQSEIENQKNNNSQILEDFEKFKQKYSEFDRIELEKSEELDELRTTITELRSENNNLTKYSDSMSKKCEEKICEVSDKNRGLLEEVQKLSAEVDETKKKLIQTNEALNAEKFRNSKLYFETVEAGQIIKELKESVSKVKKDLENSEKLLETFYNLEDVDKYNSKLLNDFFKKIEMLARLIKEYCSGNSNSFRPSLFKKRIISCQKKNSKCVNEATVSSSNLKCKLEDSMELLKDSENLIIGKIGQMEAEKLF
ncbi:MAG: hypothetical protein MHMPM18_004575, partial [Marteilia pararefringens]